MTRAFGSHKLILFGIIFLIAGVVWFALSAEPPAPNLVNTPSGSSAVLRQDLVNTLLTFRTVELNPKILSEPAFLSLRDFSTEIIAEPIGRLNPFAPLPALRGAATTTKSADIFLAR